MAADRSGQRPEIDTHLLREEGEVIVDEVKHHWAAYRRPVVETWPACSSCHVPVHRPRPGSVPLLVAFGLLALRPGHRCASTATAS